MSAGVEHLQTIAIQIPHYALGLYSPDNGLS